MKTIREVQDITSEITGFSLSELRSPRRTKKLARARQAAMFVARKRTEKSFPQIGIAFGKRDHTTVLWAVRSVEHRLSTDAETRRLVTAIDCRLMEFVSVRYATPEELGIEDAA